MIRTETSCSKEIDEFLYKIRYRALKQMPYMAHLLYLVRPVVNNNIPYMAISNTGKLHINEKCLEYDEKDTTFILLHEVLHLLGDYFNRVKGRIPQLFNMATDIYNNDILEESGFTCSFPILYPRTFNFPRFESSDFYYERLKTSDKVKFVSFTSDILEEDCEDGDITPEDLEIAIRSTAISAKEYSQKYGNVSQNLLVDVEELFTKPETDWRRIFRLRVKTSINQARGKSDYSYAKLSRRDDGNIIYPGLIGYDLKLGVLLDTSGSMENELLSKCLAQVKHICKYFTDVWFLSIDTQVQTFFQVKNPRDIYKHGKIKGGGGTILTDGFNKFKGVIDVCVAISDCYAEFGDNPGYPIVWMCERDKSGTPPWGKVVEVF